MIGSKGVTLIELVIVLIILITLSVVFLKNLSTFNKANSIEDDCKKIYAFLQEMRLKAFSQKQVLNIELNGNGTRLCETVQGDCIDLNNRFSASGNFTISKRGLFQTPGNIRALTSQGNPTYSCVAVSNTRVRLGEWNGSCVPK